MHKPQPTYPHGHFGYHLTFGGKMEDGAIPNNVKNTNDLFSRISENFGHGYFKPAFCHWPKGGYTRREAQHNHKYGKLDTTPQSFEFMRQYTTGDLGVSRQVTQSSLANRDTIPLDGKTQPLTKGALDAQARRALQLSKHPQLGARKRPQSAPSERSTDTQETLHIMSFCLSKGRAFEAAPKPAPGSTPSFANYPKRPQSAGPSLQRQKEEFSKGTAVALWEEAEHMQKSFEETEKENFGRSIIRPRSSYRSASESFRTHRPRPKSAQARMSAI